VPLLVGATAGTTATGAIDPLPAIAEICSEARLWFHCDAAWGGGALLSPRLRAHLRGIERADSITWDAHKWLSCPMGSGAFLCRHGDALRTAFEVTSGYMPSSRAGVDDAHRVSLQWSRRAIGVPVLAALATRGAGGFADLVEHQAAMGDALRTLLRDAGFEVVNETPLPLVCSTHPDMTDATATARDVAAAGRAWISAVSIDGRRRVLRACITSYRTTESDLSALVAELTSAMT
jgi:glutamate/tyrosine decarboxylase-like PLP-dependent enzyme